MVGSKVSKVTVSLPMELLEVADSLAKEYSTTRSGVFARLLKQADEAGINALMAAGYREMGEENRREAEDALNLTAEVVLRGG